MSQPDLRDHYSTAEAVRSIAFVATAPPRQCGIATFASDLANAVLAARPGVRVKWAAIDPPYTSHAYATNVRWRMRQREPASYAAAAEAINASDVDVVSLQHEFGLYGVWGDPFEDHLIGFLARLRKPLVTTLHSVLPEPSPSVRAAVQRLARRSDRVVVMADMAQRLLVERYGVEPSKLCVVPHGVPEVQLPAGSSYKERFGVANRTVISTFGLVDPRKGLEYMIEALKPVAERHPDVLYLIVGRTHPDLVRNGGETYRESLKKQVAELGLRRHVRFVNEYLTQQQIVDYLLASDLYVTPYLDPNQITSGTLAYALGAGRAIISTRYLHADEVLSRGRGILVDFRSAEQLTRATLKVLDSPLERMELEARAYDYGRETTWPKIGARMLELFDEACAERDLATGPEPGVAELTLAR